MAISAQPSTVGRVLAWFGLGAVEASPAIPPSISLGVREPGTYQGDADDTAFDMAMEKIVPSTLTDKRFHIRIAGASHQNADGTHRRAAIAKCKPLEKLELRHEPDNPYDSNATGVWTSKGKQIGYLDRRLAQEVVSQRNRLGVKWEACFCKPTIHCETNKIAGCILFLVRYLPDAE